MNIVVLIENFYNFWIYINPRAISASHFCQITRPFAAEAAHIQNISTHTEDIVSRKHLGNLNNRRPRQKSRLLFFIIIRQ